MGSDSLYQAIWAMVATVPPGWVTTYGEVARRLERCGSRQGGYALSALEAGSDIPWHRVVNRLGEISPRSQGDDHHQRERLEEEGVLFDGRGRIDLERYRWELGWESGPEERR